MRKRKIRSFSLPFSDCGLTHRCFFEIFGFWLYWDFVLYLSFRAGIYGTKTSTVSRKIKFVIFSCSPASIAAALSRTFFACTKKVPKKYPEGLRALSTPGDAVKFFEIWRRYRKFHITRKRKNAQFFFSPLSDCGLTHRYFFEILGFCYMGIWFISEFVRLNLCRINGHEICERLNLLFLIASPRKLERRFAALATAG